MIFYKAEAKAITNDKKSRFKELLVGVVLKREVFPKKIPLKLKN